MTVDASHNPSSPEASGAESGAADPAHRIRSFHRRGRMTNAKRAALAGLGDRYLLDLARVVSGGWGTTPAAADADSARVLDIGFGDGEATVGFAAAHPGTVTLAVEVHRPGIATLLQRLDALGLTNVAVYEGDALDVVDVVPPASLHAVHVFFPDPWPKIRHHARRLVRPDVVALFADRLAPGGVLHVATDAADYAVQMRAVLGAEPAFAGCVEEGNRAGRVVTKYERLGLAAGRTITDLRATRR